MVDQEILRDISIVFQVLSDKLILNQLAQAAFEVWQEEFATLAVKQFEDVVLIFLQVMQQMAEYRLWHIPVRIQTMSVGAIQCAEDNVLEEFFAQSFQQIIFCFKVGVESCSSHICGVYDILNSNSAITFFSQERAEGTKDGCSGFLLSSVHSKSFRTIFQECSIGNKRPKLSIEFCLFPV